MKATDRESAEKKLDKYEVEYMITELSNGNINIFFGKKECVDVVRSFGNVPLNQLSVEQDFILGIMLGYDRLAQCSRYLKRNVECGNHKEMNMEAVSSDGFCFNNVGRA